MYSDQEEQATRFNFTMREAESRPLGGRCGRLLSIFVSYKLNPKSLRVGIEQRGHIGWEAALIP
jgi:hypothetical protein